jgi:hypothetical protein
MVEGEMVMGLLFHRHQALMGEIDIKNGILSNLESIAD